MLCAKKHEAGIIVQFKKQLKYNDLIDDIIHIVENKSSFNEIAAKCHLSGKSFPKFVQERLPELDRELYYKVQFLRSVGRDHSMQRRISEIILFYPVMIKSRGYAEAFRQRLVSDTSIMLLEEETGLLFEKEFSNAIRWARKELLFTKE